LTVSADPEACAVAAAARHRIAFNGKFLSAGMTGVHRVAEELIRATDALISEHGHGVEHRAGHETEILCPRDARDAPGMAAVAQRRVGRLTWIPWEQAELPLHARGRLLVNLCNLGPLASRDAVTMIHDAQVHLTPASYSPAFRAWYRTALPRIGHRHRRILTVSDYSRTQLARFGVAPVERISVIHNGVDHVLRTASDPGILARLGLAPRRYACALANTQAHKNIPRLLEAFALPELADLTLVLIGPAGRADFERRGHAVPGNVVFAGRVDDAGLRGLIEAALAFLCPSTTEGFGLPPLESMALGTPAVIAPEGALPEICGPAALTAGAGNAAAWARALIRLSGEDFWRAQAARGRAHAARFTWRRAARELLDVLGALPASGDGAAQ
jgi:glycosyltransferase involved in cell wall biosynthesis